MSFQFKQLTQEILKIILLSKFEDRLMHLLAQPYHSFTDEFRSPVARTHFPRRNHPGEHGRSRLVYIKCNVIVLLKITCRTIRVYLAFYDILNYLSLRLAPSHKDDSFSAHHRIYAKRDGGARRLVDVSVEITSLPLASIVRKQYCPCAALLGCASIVETDLASLPYADNEQIQAASLFIQLGAIIGNLVLLHTAIRNVDVLFLEVYLVQERLMQAPIPALSKILRYLIILVDGISLYILERHFPFLVFFCKKRI